MSPTRMTTLAGFGEIYVILFFSFRIACINADIDNMSLRCHRITLYNVGTNTADMVGFRFKL